MMRIYLDSTSGQRKNDGGRLPRVVKIEWTTLEKFLLKRLRECNTLVISVDPALTPDCDLYVEYYDKERETDP